MRLSPRAPALVALVLCACVDAGAGTAAPSAPPSHRPPSALATTTTQDPEPVAPRATPSTTPTAEATAPPDPPQPFTVVVSHIELDDLDDAVVTGAARIPVDDAAGLAAVRRATATLERYLKGAFLDPGTRFTARPADDLLTLGALSRLTPAAKAGLAALDLDVTSSRAGPASAHARVAILGATVLHVTLDYQAQLSVMLADGRSGPVTQRGTLVFVSTPAGSRADFAEVMLQLPWEAS